MQAIRLGEHLKASISDSQVFNISSQSTFQVCGALRWIGVTESQEWICVLEFMKKQCPILDHADQPLLWHVTSDDHCCHLIPLAHIKESQFAIMSQRVELKSISNRNHPLFGNHLGCPVRVALNGREDTQSKGTLMWTGLITDQEFACVQLTDGSRDQWLLHYSSPVRCTEVIKVPDGSNSLDYVTVPIAWVRPCLKDCVHPEQNKHLMPFPSEAHKSSLSSGEKMLVDSKRFNGRVGSRVNYEVEVLQISSKENLEIPADELFKLDPLKICTEPNKLVPLRNVSETKSIRPIVSKSEPCGTTLNLGKMVNAVYSSASNGFSVNEESVSVETPNVKPSEFSNEYSERVPLRSGSATKSARPIFFKSESCGSTPGSAAMGPLFRTKTYFEIPHSMEYFQALTKNVSSEFPFAMDDSVEVTLDIDGLQSNRTGVVRWLGQHPGPPSTDLVGVVLHVKTTIGGTDGCFPGGSSKRLFFCRPGHGIVVPTTLVKLAEK